MSRHRAFGRSHPRHRVTAAASAPRLRWWDPQPANAAPHKLRGVHKINPPLFDRIHALRFVLVPLTLVAATVLITNATPIRLKWRKAHPTAEAERLLKSNAVTAANSEVFSRACKESPDRPHLLRALAVACATEDPAQARRCYERIAELGATTVQDEAGHAILLARLKDFNGASAILENSCATGLARIPLHRAALAIERDSGDFAAAAHTLDLLAGLEPPSLNDCLDTAEAAARAGTPPPLLTRVTSHLLDAVERGVADGRIAEIGEQSRRLTSLPMPDPAIQARALKALECLADSPVDQRLAVILLAHTCANNTSEDLRRACFDEIRRAGGLSAAEKDRVGAVLQSRSEHALVSEIITLPESLLERRLFGRRLESLLYLGRWKDAAAMTRDARAPLAFHNRRLLNTLSLLHDAPADNPAPLNLLTESLKESSAEKSAPACYTIGCIALEKQLPNLANEAFASAASLAGPGDAIVEGIINQTRRAGWTVGDVVRLLSRNAWHSNTELQTRLCYLRLLAGEQVEAAHAFIAGQATRGTGDAGLRLVSALGLYRQGDIAGAVKLLIPLPSHRWHQGEAAVIAGIIAASGQFEHCAPLIRQIDPSGLFSEERAMLEPWRLRLSLEQGAFGGSPSPLQAANP